MKSVVDNFSLYSSLLEANREAFSKELFKVAYHTLCGAMYLALSLQDLNLLGEVERVARDQAQTLKSHSPRAYPTNEPSYVVLYASLVETATTRRSILRNHALS